MDKLEDATERKILQLSDHKRFVQHAALPLEIGGGGGDSTGMEARVAKLEAHMEHVRADVAALTTDSGKLKTDMATLLERVAHLPSKSFVVTALLVALTVLAAVSLFAPNLQRMIGVTPSVSASAPPVAAPPLLGSPRG